MIPQIHAYNMNSNRLLNRTLLQSHNHDHDLQSYYHLNSNNKLNNKLKGSLQNSTKISLKNPQLKSEW